MFLWLPGHMDWFALGMGMAIVSVWFRRVGVALHGGSRIVPLRFSAGSVLRRLRPHGDHDCAPERLLLHPLSRWWGQISYGIYLGHHLFAVIWDKLHLFPRGM